MALFDKEPLLGALGNESYENGIEPENIDNIYKGKSWEAIEGREIEMINGMDSFIGKASQQMPKKSIEVMKEWKENE